jgi:hypothetical protein
MQDIDRARALGIEKRRSKKADTLAQVASQAFPSKEAAPPRADIPALNISRGRGDD